jgi:hypothetical protein
MALKFETWWQKIKQHREAIGVVGIVLVVVMALIIIGYRFCSVKTLVFSVPFVR